jgi:tetratricopeptide (TPR) repeat protein
VGQTAQFARNDAARLSQEAVALDEHYADAWYCLGLARDMLGQKKPALEAYERAAALEPNNSVYMAVLEQRRPRTKEP